jgi:hypothetical protein
LVTSCAGSSPWVFSITFIFKNFFAVLSLIILKTYPYHLIPLQSNTFRNTTLFKGNKCLNGFTLHLQIQFSAFSMFCWLFSELSQRISAISQSTVFSAHIYTKWNISLKCYKTAAPC